MTDIYADTTIAVADTYAGQVAARPDRLPFTRTIWRLVFLISLGGVFELYDLLLSETRQ